MTGPYRAILYKEVYYMNTFALKGTFLDTPAPDTFRVREGYLLMCKRPVRRIQRDCPRRGGSSRLYG